MPGATEQSDTHVIGADGAALNCTIRAPKKDPWNRALTTMGGSIPGDPGTDKRQLRRVHKNVYEHPFGKALDLSRGR